MEKGDIIGLALIAIAFAVGMVLIGFGSNNIIEIPRENGCVEVITENNRVFGKDTIDRSLICTKEIG